jgi:hypothetical protein
MHPKDPASETMCSLQHQAMGKVQTPAIPSVTRRRQNPTESASIAAHNLMGAHQLVLLWLPPHRNLCQSSCYYRPQETKMWEFGVASNGMMFIQKFSKSHNCFIICNLGTYKQRGILTSLTFLENIQGFAGRASL